VREAIKIIKMMPGIHIKEIRGFSHMHHLKFILPIIFCNIIHWFDRPGN
jgi:hypothetical protein